VKESGSAEQDDALVTKFKKKFADLAEVQMAEVGKLKASFMANQKERTD